MRDYLIATGIPEDDCNDGQVLSRECMKIDAELRLLAERWSRVKARRAAATRRCDCKLAGPGSTRDPAIFTKQHA